MQFKSLRTVYSVTVGRLSWETEDLATAFDIDCGNVTGCEGLRFKMPPKAGKESDYLVVDNSSLPLKLLGRYKFMYPDSIKWKYLVSCAN